MSDKCPQCGADERCDSPSATTHGSTIVVHRSWQCGSWHIDWGPGGVQKRQSEACRITELTAERDRLAAVLRNIAAAKPGWPSGVCGETYAGFAARLQEMAQQAAREAAGGKQ